MGHTVEKTEETVEKTQERSLKALERYNSADIVLNLGGGALLGGEKDIQPEDSKRALNEMRKIIDGKLKA